MAPIKIEFVDKMGTDLTVVNAARVSYDTKSTEITPRDEGLLHFLAEHGHVTPFRHPYVTFRCRAPIFLARQLGKHQVGFSWNEVSRRYKDGDAVPIECYVPDEVMARPEKLMTQMAIPMDSEFAQDAQHIIHQANQTAIRQYNLLLEMGVAPEQARGVLPQNMVTEWIWTGSLYGWFSLLRQRFSEHAQYEARIFAEAVDEEMGKLFPLSWAALKKHNNVE